MIGSARDIVESVAVPRFAFTDLPLGNPVGPADDPTQQRRILSEALAFAASAAHARSSEVIAVEWNGHPDWRDSYMSLENVDSLRQAGEARRAAQAAKKAGPTSTAE